MFVNYERASPGSDASIVGPARIEWMPELPGPHWQMPRPRLWSAPRTEFATIVRGLFRHTICSMTRIVLSAMWRITLNGCGNHARSREVVRYSARCLVDPPLAMQNRPADSKRFMRTIMLPTSGVWLHEHHLHMGTGFLLHAHLLAPVLLDAPAGAMGLHRFPFTQSRVRG